MKKSLLGVTALILLGGVSGFAQSSLKGGPNFGGALNKVFGTNQVFIARMDFQTSQGPDNSITMPGKMSFDHGKSRFEINMSEVQGSQMPADTAQQLKSMGLDTVISISRPDMKLGFVVYPGLSSYVQAATHEATDTNGADEYQVDTAAGGKATLDGHECMKSSMTVTGKDGIKHEYTLWNAADLKGFPVKVETTESGGSVTLRFKEVTFAKPAANLFDPPSGYTKYEDVQNMMMTEMMKKMGSPGLPPAQK